MIFINFYVKTRKDKQALHTVGNVKKQETLDSNFDELSVTLVV